MKRSLILFALVVAGCMEAPADGGLEAAGNQSVLREYFVLGGSAMSYQDCVARGGLVIHDQGSSMFACDPRVTHHNSVPDNEFDHPEA